MSFDRYLRIPQGKMFVDKFLQFEPDEEVNCVLCGSHKKDIWFSFGAFKAVRCKGCNLRYMSPRLSNEKLQKVYETTYQPNKDYEGRIHDMSTAQERQRKRRDMEIEIKSTLRHKKGGRVLDVGCGAGIYLEALPDTWEKFGVDRASWAAEHTQKILNIPVIFREIEDVQFPDEYFDVINMTYVIEHLRNPIKMLRQLNKWLKKEGLFMLSAPNFGSACARVFREFYRLVDPCQHLYMFTPQTLKKALIHSGFKVKKIYLPYFGTPYCNLKDFSRFFSNALNRFLLPVYLKINRIPTVDKLISPPFYGNIMVVKAYKKG